MKLSLKQKAVLITAGSLFGVVFGSYLVALILVNVSTQTIMNGLGIGVATFFIWVFYVVVLSRLEYTEKLKEMTEKKD